ALHVADFFLFAPPLAAPVGHAFPPRRSSDLFRSPHLCRRSGEGFPAGYRQAAPSAFSRCGSGWGRNARGNRRTTGRRHLALLRRSEEHTSELQSRENLVCRLLPEKEKLEQVL